MCEGFHCEGREGGNKEVVTLFRCKEVGEVFFYNCWGSRLERWFIDMSSGVGQCCSVVCKVV